MSCLTFQFPLGDKYLSVTDTAGCSVAERPPEDQDEDMKPLPHAEPLFRMAVVTTCCCLSFFSFPFCSQCPSHFHILLFLHSAFSSYLPSVSAFWPGASAFLPIPVRLIDGTRKAVAGRTVVSWRLATDGTNGSSEESCTAQGRRTTSPPPLVYWLIKQNKS